MNNDKIISLKPFLESLAEAEENRRMYFEEREAELEEEERYAHEYEAYLKSQGLDDTSGLPPPSDGFRDIDLDDVDDVMTAFDRLVTAQREEHIDAVEALETIRGLLDLAQQKDEVVQVHSAPEIRDPHPDEPLTLFEAVCLPELGGQLFMGADIPGRPGRMSVKTLRGEILAGRLMRVPPLNKNFYVSRKSIKEWTEWRDPGNPLTSSGSSPNSPRTGGSGRTATGRSQMEKSELARDSALSFVNRLRQPGSSTK